MRLMDLVIAIFFRIEPKKELFFWVMFPDFNISAVFNADYLLQDTHADLHCPFGIIITGTLSHLSHRKRETPAAIGIMITNPLGTISRRYRTVVTTPFYIPQPPLEATITYRGIVLITAK